MTQSQYQDAKRLTENLEKLTSKREVLFSIVTKSDLAENNLILSHSSSGKVILDGEFRDVVSTFCTDWLEKKIESLEKEFEAI